MAMAFVPSHAQFGIGAAALLDLFRIGQGWRYPFFVGFSINVVALFARLRLIATPEFERLFETRYRQPAPVVEKLRFEGQTMLLGAFDPLASFAMFHLVTVFPLSRVVLFTPESAPRFLLIEMVGAVFAPLAALILSARYGLWSVGLYLLSGTACTIGAPLISRNWAKNVRN